MKENKENLEKVFKDRLYNDRVEPSDNFWDNINKNIPENKEGKKLNFLIKDYKYAIAASVSAIIVAVGFILFNFIKPTINDNQDHNLAQKVTTSSSKSKDQTNNKNSEKTDQEIKTNSDQKSPKKKITDNQNNQVQKSKNKPEKTTSKSDNQSFITYKVDNNIKKYTLKDGSEVFLNKNSSLKLPSDFNKQNRTAYLNGEAYFKIKHQKNSGFKVIGNHSVVKVLGTEFSLKSKKDNYTDKLMLVKGKVSFSNKNESKKVVLQKGQSALIKNGDPVKVNLSPNFYAWKTNKLVFDNTSLDKVVNVLESHFSRSVVIKNENLKKCRFTGKFKNKDIEEVLQVIKISLGIKYSKQNKSIILEGQGCNTN